jgi:hypothetical protein
MAMMDTPTTVTVKAGTLNALRSYKTPGMTMDDVLNELMADTPPESFWKEIERRMDEPDIPKKEAYRMLGWKR